MNQIVKTKRMSLRMLSDEEMKKLISEEKDPEMIQAYTEMYTGCVENPDQRPWYAIWVMELEDKTRVGDFCFKGLNSDGSVEIGYGVIPKYWGNGYATEMVESITKWALSQPGVSRIEAETDLNNLASQRVLEKAGFIPNGIMGGRRSAVCTGALREEFTITAKREDGTIVASENFHFNAGKEKMYLIVTLDGRIVVYTNK